MRRFLGLCLIGYMGSLALIFFIQRDLMYHPDATKPQVPASYGLENAQEVTIQATPETRLNAWYIAPQNEMPLLIYFHGNAGNLSDRYRKIGDFTSQGMGMLALSYRGYGGSEGTPTEQGLYADARAALAYIVNEQKIPAHRIILYGESLGTGVAVQLATEVKVGLVVLESPYTSTVNRATEIYPWLPVSWLMWDRFESIDKIAQIQDPLLIFHNTGDAVIPIHHGRTLYAAAKAPKRAIWFKHQGHTDFDWARLEREIRRGYEQHNKNSYAPFLKAL